MKYKLPLVFISAGIVFATAFGATSAAWAVTDNADPFGVKVGIFYDAGMRTILLDTGGSSLWDQAGATFTAHLWGGSESSSSDVDMTKVGTTSIYSAEVSANYGKVVFARIASGKTLDTNWENVWNKSEDLDLPNDGKDLYTITGWGPGSGTEDEKKTCPGTWSTHVCTAGEPVITHVTLETCEEDGLDNVKTYCIFCNELMSDDDVPVTKHHQMPLTHHNMKEATCTENGTIEYWECEKCKEKFIDYAGTYKATEIVVPAKGHTLSQWQHDISTHYMICPDCGLHFGTEPHSGGTITEEHGAICDICGFEYTEPLEHIHSFVPHQAVSPTCTETGNELYYTCSGCSLIFNANKEQISDVPTLPASGHTKVTQSATDATCTTPGNTTYYECSTCHKYYSDSAMTNEIVADSWVIPSTGHSYSNHKCTKCGEIESGWTEVTFKATKDVGEGHSLIIVGSFNSWSTSSGYVSMSWTTGNVWVGTIMLANGNYEYKAIQRDWKDFWEYDPNHSVSLTGGTKIISWSPNINYN